LEEEREKEKRLKGVEEMKKMLDLQIKEKKRKHEQIQVFDKKYANDLTVNAEKFHKEVKQKEVKKIERKSLYKMELDHQMIQKNNNAKASMDEIEKVINRDIINEIKSAHKH
jgi:hypothetical protein